MPGVVVVVVVMVSVAVTAVVPVMLTGEVVPKLRVGAEAAPLGLDVTAAVSVTLPVKPAAGVTVTVDVFPVVAPAAMVTAAPVMEYVGGGGGVAVMKEAMVPFVVPVAFCATAWK